MASQNDEPMNPDMSETSDVEGGYLTQESITRANDLGLLPAARVEAGDPEMGDVSDVTARPSFAGVFDTDLYTDAARNALDAERERKQEGSRYLEQHQQFNVVDQSTNLRGSHHPPEEVQPPPPVFKSTHSWSKRLDGLRGKSSTARFGANTQSVTRRPSLMNFVGMDLEDIGLGESIGRSLGRSRGKQKDSNFQDDLRMSFNEHLAYFEENEVWAKFKKCCLYVGLFLLLFVGIFFLVRPVYDLVLDKIDSAMAPAPSNELSPTLAPSSPPQHYSVVHITPPKEGAEIRIEALKHTILQSGISDDADLNDIHSIPFYALRWLSDTDEAELSIGDDHILERFALAVFFYTARPDIAKAHSNGKTWLFNSNDPILKKWMNSPDICSWQGITCVNGKVNEFNVTNLSIFGGLPQELRAFTDLHILDMSDNNMFGTIPALIKDGVGMTKLRHLHLQKNNFIGAIPPSVFQMSSLATLDLHHNSLSGRIPDLMNNLVKLEKLNLDRNKLRGTIPSSIAETTSLHELRLERNHFAGTVPPLTRLSKLENLWLGNNYLTGTLPEEWQTLKRLSNLVVSHNSFSGTIPNQYGTSLHKLERLALNGNKLTGTIPPELGNLGNLKVLFLDDNLLVGELPAELGQLRSIGSLNVGTNQLTGEVASEICDLKSRNLTFLSADCNSGNVSCTCCDKCF